MPISLKDFDDPILVDATVRFRARSDRIRKTLRGITRPRDPEAETVARMRVYEDRERTLRDSGVVGFQRKIGPMYDLLSYEFLEQGMLAGQAVGMVEIESIDGYGSGFLVAPDVMLTNHHVLPTVRVAREARFRLGFEDNTIKVMPTSPSVTLPVDPASFFVTSKELDFTFVAVDTEVAEMDLSWLPLIEEQGKIMISHPVNLIQHPDGRVKHVVVHNSHLLDLEDGSDDEMYCWYSSDTDKGSSGSPVFNCRWEVIALHHKAVPKTNKNDEVLDINGQTMTEKRFKEQPNKVHWIGNEGIRVSRLVEKFRTMDIKKKFVQIRVDIVTLWNSLIARRIGLKRGWL